MLSQGNCPNLGSLTIRGCGLAAEAMASMVKADWPSLKRLSLEEEPNLDAVAVGHLSAAKFSVTDLTLSGMPVSAAMAAELSKLKLPHLSSISLAATDLTTAAVIQLATADWPELLHLDLSQNNVRRHESI